MTGTKKRAAGSGGGATVAAAAYTKKAGSIRARAYCSSANLGPGFDAFGIALDAFYDEVAISIPRGNTNSNVITITNDLASRKGGHDAGRGEWRPRSPQDRQPTEPTVPPAPPTDPDANTAGLVVKSMLQEHGITDDVAITIKKGVPTGLGLGSSAASAAAAAIACDKLFGLRQDKTGLVRAAGRGEEASAGTIHYDNVAASVAGGFVLVRPFEPIVVASFPVMPDLRFCLAIPQMATPDKKTKVSRGVLPKKVKLEDAVRNMANASLLAVSLATGKPDMLGRGVTSDVIAEPARKHMIPGFDDVRRGALDAGAKEVMISGAGPSVIAVMAGATRAQQRVVAAAMSAGFQGAGMECRTITCRAARGARVVPASRGRTGP